MPSSPHDQQIQDQADASEALYQEVNEKRLLAHDVIFRLHEVGKPALGQIQLLWMACSLAIKDLDRSMWDRMIEEAKAKS